MPHPIDLHVGKRLRYRRTLLGYTQEGIAQHAGITFQQVQKYEHGGNRISASRLYEFSKILATTPSYFFEDFADADLKELQHAARDNPEYVKDSMLSREMLEMARSYYRILDVSVRKRVYDLIKALGVEPPTKEGKG